MDNTELRQIKADCLIDLRCYLPTVREKLDSIDTRLYEYASDAIAPLDFCLQDTNVADSVASLHELLCMKKCLRKMITYPLDIDYALRWLRSIEGEWQHGRHVAGGVKFQTPRGAQYVPLMPFQAWIVLMMMMPQKIISMQRPPREGEELLPSEFIQDGIVHDMRRLCNESDILITRKAGKTELGASLDFAEFAVMGESNEQVSIVANSASQAIDIAYKAVKYYALQIDPTSVNKLGGKLFKVGVKSMQFASGILRTASVTAFAAGGKARDGYNSGWVHNDEPGQGKYTSETNDMESTVQELVGSGGTRRERMRLNTSTAGKVVSGPYKTHIEQLQEQLLQEAAIELGTIQELPYDNNFAILLRTDPWDYDGSVESLRHPYIYRRVNRSIGVTVQPTWYEERIEKALTGTSEDRLEVLTKDFNIWQSEKLKKWIQGEKIRSLQKKGLSLKKLKKGEWIAFGGMDFSKGNDLCSIGWLAMNKKTKEVIWDVDAWIAYEQLKSNPNHVLYQEWMESGHLHVCPGEILDGAAILNVIEEVSQHVSIFGMGYDRYDSDRFITHIRAWMISRLKKKGLSDKQIEAELSLRLQPISQLFGTFNSATQVVWDDVHWSPRRLYIADNPLLPWCFDNVVLAQDNMENVKPVKNPNRPNAKVDPVQCICMAYILRGIIFQMKKK